jgi:hypothetical protein
MGYLPIEDQYKYARSARIGCDLYKPYITTLLGRLDSCMHNMQMGKDEGRPRVSYIMPRISTWALRDQVVDLVRESDEEYLERVIEDCDARLRMARLGRGDLTSQQINHAWSTLTKEERIWFDYSLPIVTTHDILDFKWSDSNNLRTLSNTAGALEFLLKVHGEVSDSVVLYSANDCGVLLNKESAEKLIVLMKGIKPLEDLVTQNNNELHFYSDNMPSIIAKLHSTRTPTSHPSSLLTCAIPPA